MYLADYHTHSRISPDGSCTMTDMARSAIQKGLQEICFTDHVEPFVWGDGSRPPLPHDWTPLREEFARAQAEVGDQIRLRLGIELGDAIIDLHHTEKMLENAPEFDFVIVFDESWAFGEEKNRWLYTAITRAKEKLLIVR